MRADAETIRAALEARVKVDGLLAEREEAYRPDCGIGGTDRAGYGRAGRICIS